MIVAAIDTARSCCHTDIFRGTDISLNKHVMRDIFIISYDLYKTRESAFCIRLPSWWKFMKFLQNC